MNTFNRKASALAGLVAFGLSGTLSVNAAEPVNANKATSPACHQETRRIAVWPHGPGKGLQMARFETRTLTVCNQKKSQPERAAIAPTFGPRHR